MPPDRVDKLALAVGLDIYRAYRQLMSSDRFQRLENAGARMQRLLWASTKTKDPAASDTLYVHGLAAPFTVNTMPDDTLEAFFEHGEVGDPLPATAATPTRCSPVSPRPAWTWARSRPAAARWRHVFRVRLERAHGPDRGAGLGGHLTTPGQEAARVGFAGQGTVRWMSIRSTEAPRATRTVATISGGNRPCSMTPGVVDSQAASAAGSPAGPW